MKRNIILLVTVMLASACTLDTLEYGKIDPGIFPQTKDDADALVVSAAYHPFNSWYLFNSAWGYQALSDFTCDYVGLSWQGAYIGFDMTGAGGYPITDEDRTPVYIYSKYLSGMELALERIKDVPMDEGDRNVLNAQLHCAMALLAYLEYDLYGPVSLPSVESLQKPLENIITPRASEKEMQDYIETNALEAARYLPYKWDAGMYGRFTKGCAQMVLLKLYMMTRRWADAEAVGAEIIKPEYGYELMPDYNDMFTLANEQNSEYIYAGACKIGYGMSNTYFAHVLPSDFPSSYGSSIMRWGVYHITWRFYDTYDPADRRLERIIAEYDGDGGAHHSRAEATGSTKGGLYYGAIPLKFKLEGVVGQNCEIDLPLFRYADAITLYAEAMVRNGEKVTGEAIEYMNKLRRRAGLPDIDIEECATVSKFLDAILLERGHEFYMEGVRRSDLIRHGKFIQACEYKLQDQGMLTDARRARIYQKTNGTRYDFERLPVPLSIITAGQGLILQNPGY